MESELFPPDISWCFSNLHESFLPLPRLWSCLWRGMGWPWSLLEPPAARVAAGLDGPFLELGSGNDAGRLPRLWLCHGWCSQSWHLGCSVPWDGLSQGAPGKAVPWDGPLVAGAAPGTGGSWGCWITAAGDTWTKIFGAWLRGAVTVGSDHRPG